MNTGEEFIRTYRGYDIIKVGQNNYQVRDGSFPVTNCSTAWGCLVWIDERLSP